MTVFQTGPTALLTESTRKNRCISVEYLVLSRVEICDWCPFLGLTWQAERVVLTVGGEVMHSWWAKPVKAKAWDRASQALKVLVEGEVKLL